MVPPLFTTQDCLNQLPTMAINRQDNGCYQYVLLLFRHTTREGFVATTSYRFPPTTGSLNSAELTILGQRFLISLN